MSEQSRSSRRDTDEPEPVTPPPAPQTSARAQDDDLDDLLDEVDGVLETNAEEFVRSFVQKGGQ